MSGVNADSRRWLAAGDSPTGVSQFEERSVKTDARGVFRIAGLAAGSFHLTARLERTSTEASRTVTTTDGSMLDDIVLVLPLGKSIAGTLRLATGLPPGDEMAGELWMSAVADGERHMGRVGRDGTFRIEGLPDGEYEVSMMHPPRGFVLTPRRDVKAGTDGLQLVLEPSAIVAGRVVDAEGKPRQARVYAHVSEGGSPLHPTDEQGYFRIEVPQSFRGTVGAMTTDVVMQQGSVEDVAAGRTDVVIKLEPRGGRER